MASSHSGRGTNQAPVAPLHGSGPALATTLLSLVQALLHQGLSEQDVVRRVLDDLSAGRAVLIGSFRGCRLDSCGESSRPASR
jgi:hypothetical protein